VGSDLGSLLRGWPPTPLWLGRERVLHFLRTSPQASSRMARFTEYQVLGRKLPTEAEPAPKVRPVFLAVLCVRGDVSTD
jgi:hypothetical protein